MSSSRGVLWPADLGFVSSFLFFFLFFLTVVSSFVLWLVLGYFSWLLFVSLSVRMKGIDLKTFLNNDLFKWDLDSAQSLTPCYSATTLQALVFCSVGRCEIWSSYLPSW